MFIWEAKRTDETRLVESVLRHAGFPVVEAYRLDSASIWVRVVDERFYGLTHPERADLLEPALASLPTETLRDIICLYLFWTLDENMERNSSFVYGSDYTGL
jgi:hypothetical protein